MSDILDRRHRGSRTAPGLDAEAVRTAYRRWAGVYDAVFGGIFLNARRRAVSLVNRLPGRDVLEVGVGTGLARTASPLISARHTRPQHHNHPFAARQIPPRRSR